MKKAYFELINLYLLMPMMDLQSEAWTEHTIIAHDQPRIFTGFSITDFEI